ncbi:class I adenylate-forming enzyme family protein [Acidovorax sp. CCYZU-2555]|uniref:class I adenylate-forming enzyme family protein n=1 Tax=Acidovorax sp. CCYZU-2555 TaxID=2835042 RepID=UPI001BCFF51F|nr:class I adenylate-forming enzyme family protein [Acidovorax sp. CCYZU-2555]MBS7779541.1 acyl--CoA ligase [Acidovorax sp. CCYZU-2555]
MSADTVSDPVVGWPAPLRQALAAPFGSIPEMVALNARLRGDHAALVLDGAQGLQVLGYAALDRQVERVAAALRRDGLRAGDCIALCAATSLPYVVTYLGAARAGVVVAPLPPSATAAQLAGLAANAGARCLFTDAEVAALWPADAALARVLLDDGAPGKRWSDWLAEPGAVPGAGAAQLSPQAPFNIIYSSGTTGVPKGIVQSCGMRWAQLQRAPASGFGPDAVTLLALPLYSNLTLTNLLGALGLGGTVVLLARFDAGRYLALAAQQRATHSVLVPVQFRRLLDHTDFARTDLSALRRKFSAGAPFAAALKAEVLRRWPGELTEYYGLTEGGGRTELPAHRFPDKLGTIGRPSAGNDIRVIDEQGRELGPHAVGELVGHSATMMSGYHGLPEQTRAAEWFDAQGKRFIRTGDIGRFDADGFVVLVDRRKDMVISGGFNLYPSDLEAVLQQHPAVAEAAVTGVASLRWGETPVAFVVLRRGADIDAPALRAWANERLGKSQRLADLVLVAQLPRSEVGKVLKRQLRDGFDRPVP